jgi:carbon storage regulator CsrA
MLVVERRTGEDVVLAVEGFAAPIVIRLIRTMRGRAKIGIDAPPGVLILRSELQRTWEERQDQA